MAEDLYGIAEFLSARIVGEIVIKVICRSKNACANREFLGLERFDLDIELNVF